MSKKKKNKSLPPPPPIPQYLTIKTKILNKKKLLLELFLIFLSAFILTTIIALQRQPINTHQAYGDNYYYHHNAQLLSKIWKAPLKYTFALLTHSLSEKELTNIGFNHYSSIDTIFRAPSFIWYHSFWIAIFGDSEFANLLSQTFLLALIMLLIYYIILKKINRKFAFISFVLSFLYIPFHTSATITMTELWQTTNLLLLFIISENIFTSKIITWKKTLFLFLILLSTTLAKSSLKYLYIFFLITLVYLIIRHYNKKIIRKSLMIFFICFVIVFSLWTQIYRNGINNRSVGNSLGWLVFWAGGIPQTEGKIPIGTVHTKEFRDNINKGTDNFWYNRYAQVCKYAMIQLIKKNPVTYTSMVIKKINSLLFNPPWYNYNNMHLHKLKNLYLRPYHIILLLSTFIAFFYLPTSFYFLKYFFITILSYFFLIYGMANPSTRFFLPLISFYIIFTILLMYHIIKTKDYIYLLKCILSISLFFIFFQKNLLVHLIPNLFLISSIKFVSLIVFFSYLLSIIPQSQLHKNKNKQSLSFLLKYYSKQQETPTYLFLFLFFFLSNIAFSFDDLQLNHFLYNLQSKKTIIQKIFLSKNTLVDLKIKTDKTYIAIDVRPMNQKDLIKIKINNVIETNIFIKDALTLISSNIAQPKFKQNQWIFLPIPASILKKSNIIKISTQHKLKLFYHLKSKITIPSVVNRFDISIVEGYNTFIDGRIMTSPKILSQRESFINNTLSKTKDFNIFIIRKENGDYYIRKEYEKLNSMPIKYIALINPLDRKLVFWSKTNPGEDFVVVHGNLYKYLAGELDRFYSGYHWY